MRKLLIIVSILFLTACSSEEITSLDEMKISPTDFSKREIKLLEGLMGQEVLGYDVKSIPNEHLLNIIVEHYHDGVKQENVVEMADSLENKLESIVITKEKTDKGFTFKTIVLYENGFNSMVSNGVYEEVNASSLFKKLEEEVKFTLNEEIIIGLAIEDNGNKLMKGTLKEDDPRFQEIIDLYQDVFVYKVSVSKE
ncbi:hypothetical protein [Metabacillus litoralis]|uniref:Uncharacterized protein n=1 Tax=Metabacillus litoralis TaxID=152268 RepID=A0A179SUQ5_9BACI|nr:hypothetical protein [Metabacillus litoralis]OAS85124.1 hypothetical protein A6K24_06330 [Metabacillus litoralis]